MQSSSVINSRGQIIVPAELRKKYHLKEGATVVFREERGRLVLSLSDFEAIYKLQGSLRDYQLEACLGEERRVAHRREDER